MPNSSLLEKNLTKPPRAPKLAPQTKNQGYTRQLRIPFRLLGILSKLLTYIQSDKGNGLVERAVSRATQEVL